MDSERKKYEERTLASLDCIKRLYRNREQKLPEIVYGQYIIWYSRSYNDAYYVKYLDFIQIISDL